MHQRWVNTLEQLKEVNQNPNLFAQSHEQDDLKQKTTNSEQTCENLEEMYRLADMQVCLQVELER